MTNPFIVCDMGVIGYRVVELLHRLGERVVVITERALEERLLTAEAKGVRVLLGRFLPRQFPSGQGAEPRKGASRVKCLKSSTT